MTSESLEPIGSALSGGRYEITSKLGEGGMGAVYRAKDHNLGADVVIKLPHRSMVTDAEFSRRFRDEVRSLVRLSHPHIVKVTDVGEWMSIPFAVLQFLPGGSLEERQAAWRGSAALASLGGWLGPVGGALDYVHSQGMVHRDVKPANILFDGQGHAFLGDFGVVKVLAAASERSQTKAMTGTGMVLGTPHYMAPELIMGDPFDGRVDQYALAVTAYELLCGRRPFEHDVPTRVLMMQTVDAPPSPSAHCNGMPARMESALLRGLAKNPNDRYPSCAAFAAAMVEASGVGRGAQAGRARLRCDSCGQTMTVSVEALAKLSRSGRTEPCPRCKAPLDLTAGTASVLPPAPSGEMARGNTAVLEVGSGTGELKTPAVATPETSKRSGTVLIGGSTAETLAETVPTLGADLGIVTVKIETQPRQPTVAATEPVVSTTGNPPWVPIGLAAAAVILIAGTGFYWASASTPPAVAMVKTQEVDSFPVRSVWSRQKSARKRPIAAATSNPAPSLDGLDFESKTGRSLSSSPDREPDSPDGSPQQVAFQTGGKKSTRGLLGTSTGDRPSNVSNTTMSGDSITSGAEKSANPRTSRDAEPRPSPKAVTAVQEPDPIPDDQNPSAKNIPLAKILASPNAYAGQLITLEQVYCVGRTPWQMPDGSLRVELIESRLKLTPTEAVVEFGSKRYVLGLDSRLADRLSKMEKMSIASNQPPEKPDWILQPADLTVKINDKTPSGDEPAGRIVRIEMFEGFDNQIRGTAKLIYVVRFRTLTLTANSETSQYGNADEWKKPPKLGRAYNALQDVFKSNLQRKSQMKWAQVNAQMNSIISAGMRQSAAEQAATDARARRLATTPANMLAP